MKTCKYCLAPVENLLACSCGEHVKTLLLKHAKKVKSYYKRHSLRRISRGIVRKHRGLRRKECNVTPWDLWKLAKKQKMLCPLTGRRLATDNISVDHIIPLVKGGTHALSNLRLVRKEANLARHTLSDEEFYSLCLDVVKQMEQKNP